MGSRTKNQKAKAKRHQKRREKQNKKAKLRQKQGSTREPLHVRHQKRINAQVATAWPDETPEDVAVFDDAVRDSLTDEIQAQVRAVREALELTSHKQEQAAIERVSQIPRSSPLSQWRMLIRGLAAWRSNDDDAMHKAWDRLDPNRRPARIAQVLLASQCDDLSNINSATPGENQSVVPAPHIPTSDGNLTNGSSSPMGSTTDPTETHPASIGDASQLGVAPDPPTMAKQLDDHQLYLAKLVRRVCFNRPAIQAVRTAVDVPLEEDELLRPEIIRGLADVVRFYESIEPDFVAALRQVVLQRAAGQMYIDLFEQAAGTFVGPPHDPKNSFLKFHYFKAEEDSADEAKCAILKYVEQDVPQHVKLPDPIRQALIGLAYSQLATLTIEASNRYGGFWRSDPLESDPIQCRELIAIYEKSIKAYPKHEKIYENFSDWITRAINRNDLPPKFIKLLKDTLQLTMEQRSYNIPDSLEPRIWLADHYLKNEQMEAAEPHVKWLAGSRQHDPRIKSMPWKWLVLESMRLCRRKSWLDQVPEKLAEAQSAWPAWLPSDWFPYLHAGFLLRSGDTAGYQKLRSEICMEQRQKPDSPRDACMMLAAAQRMRVPAADLKPLRASVDELVKRVKQIPFEDLICLGSFLWDLERMRISYPAYRSHGSKFGKRMIKLMRESPQHLNDHSQHHAFVPAMLWASESSFWPRNYVVNMGNQYNTLALNDPYLAAGWIRAFQDRRSINFVKLKPYRDLVAASLNTQSDPFYYFWMNRIVEQFDETAINDADRFSAFFNAFDFASDDDFNFPSNSNDSESRECNCPSCRAKRESNSQ